MCDSDERRICFYTTPPFIVGDEYEKWLHVLFSQCPDKPAVETKLEQPACILDFPRFSIQVDFDGLIHLQIPELLEQMRNPSGQQRDDQFAYRGKYLMHLNAFFTLLDFSIRKHQRIHLLQLTNLRQEDVVILRYHDGEYSGAHLDRGHSSLWVMERFGPIGNFITRNYVHEETIREAAILLSSHFGDKELLHALSGVAAAYGHFHSLDFGPCLVNAWFTCEQLLSQAWYDYVESMLPSDQEARKKHLELMNSTASVRGQVLQLAGVLPSDLFLDMCEVRSIRNDVAHGSRAERERRKALRSDTDFTFEPREVTYENCSMAMSVLNRLIETQYDIDLELMSAVQWRGW